MKRFGSVVSVAAIISIFLVGYTCQQVEPPLLAGEDCRVVIREWVGGPVWYAGNNTPNGVILFINEPFAGATNQTYEVEGSTKEEVVNDLFDPENGKAPDVGGVRYAGSHDLNVQFSWNQTGTNPQTGNLTIHIFNLTWDSTVTLPHWDPPEGVDQGDLDAWNQFLKELERHEQGHVDIANAGMIAVRAAVVCTTIEVAPGATKKEIDDAVWNHITGTVQYQQMQRAQDNYDAPYDPDTNPTGTNRGKENGQNAVLCGG